MIRVTIADLLAHRLRLTLTAVTIATGAALVAGTFLLTDSVQAALNAPAAAGTPAVVVEPAGAAGGKGAGPVASLPTSLAARIRAVRGVTAADGLVTASKVTLIGKSEHPITHRRAPNELVSYPTASALAAQYTIESGRPPRYPGEALIDAATAHALGYRIGDRIWVLTAAGRRAVTLTGITGFGGLDSPPDAQIGSFDTPTVLVIPTATAQQLTGLAGRYTEIDVLARPGVVAAALRSQIARLLPPGAEALTGQRAAQQQAADAANYLGNLREYLLAFAVAALVVAAFVIASTFSILTGQRTREYALLRVVGASRGQLLRSALAEAGILGLTASAAGTGFGTAAAAGLRGLIAVLGGTLPARGLVFEPNPTVIALATGTAVTVAAALRPARRAAAIRPIQALRAAAPAPVRQSRRRLIAALAGTAAIALTATGVLSHTSPNTVLVAAGALTAAGAVLAAGPLLAPPAARLIAAPAASRRGPAHRASVTAALARDNAAQNPRRTAALAGILTVGLATAVTISIIAASAQAAARDAITATSHADLYLSGSITPSLARAVAAEPGVGATMRVDAPLVQVAGTQTRIDGIDPAGAAVVNLGVRTGSLATLRGNALFVSTVQAARHGWRTGSPVTVSFGQGPPRTLRVAGTFADKRFLGDDYLMPIQALFRDMPSQASQASLLLIQAADGARAISIRAAVTALLPRYPDATLLTPAQYRSGRGADLGDISHILGLFTALVVFTDIIAVLGIANALTLSVTERIGELAVLRALGLTRHQLAATIRVESVITCLLGALPGTAVGAAAGTAIAATLTRDQTGVVTIAASPLQLGTALTLTCLAALLAGSIPARHAARTQPLQAMSEQQ